MKRIVGLDGVRALACLLVLAHHTFPRMPKTDSLTSDLVQKTGGFGQAGVSVFFVLSGLLLSFPFWKALYHSTDRPDFQVFVVRRLARIAPGYYLVLAVTTVFSIVAFSTVFDLQLLIRLLSAIFFVNSVHPVTFYPTDINGPLWSISFEVLSYAMLFGSLLVLFRFHWLRKFYVGLVFFIGVAVGSMIAHLAWMSIIGKPTVDVGWEFGIIGFARTWMPHTNPFSLFNHFIIGVIGSSVLVVGTAKWRPGFQFDVLFLACTCLMAAGIGSLFLFQDDPFYGWFQSLYMWPFFPLMMVSWLVLLPFTRVLHAVFEITLLRFIAQISFGIYVWHMLVIEAVVMWFFPDFVYEGGMSLFDWLVAETLVVLVTFAIASMSWFWFERPILKRFSDIRKPFTPPTATLV
ncbi:MAG: acyltransferase [Reinekea sp.]|nr:acyltransferase [Reinekea sp.]